MTTKNGLKAQTKKQTDKKTKRRKGGRLTERQKRQKDRITERQKDMTDLQKDSKGKIKMDSAHVKDPFDVFF